MSENINPNDFLLRTFTTNDYPEVLSLWELTGLGGEHRGDNLEIIQKTLEAGGIFFILEYLPKNKIIGTAWITNDMRRLYLHHFGIHPDFQGKGLSHILAKACVEFGKKLNLQMKLEVHKNNIIAKRLYEKYLFKFLGDYEIFIIRQYT